MQRTSDGTSTRFKTGWPGDPGFPIPMPQFKPGDRRQFVGPNYWHNGPEIIDYREVTIADGGEYFEARGCRPDGCQAEAELSRRGRIKTFSKGSRRRLMRYMSKISKRGALPNFLTLTYGAIWPGPEECKRHLDSFGKRLIRAYGGISFIWRMEWQKRGAPHFHLLVWGGPRILGGADSGYRKNCNVDLFQHLRDMWCEVIGVAMTAKERESSTRYERVNSTKQCYYYTSKYLGKVLPGDEVDERYEFPGRQWGVIGRKNIAKLITLIKKTVTVDEFMAIKNRIAYVIKETSGYVIETYGVWIGMGCYIDSDIALKIVAGAMEAPF